MGVLLEIYVGVGGRTAELHGDAALLLPIGGQGLDRIELLSIAEGDLEAEGAIGGKRNVLAADGQAGGGIGGAVNNQFSVGHQPEGALASGHATDARATAAGGPGAGA